MAWPGFLFFGVRLLTLESELSQFCGSCQFYQHTRQLRYTEGVKYLAERAGAFWLIDLIASYQGYSQVQAESFQLWNLQVADASAMATMRRDTGCDPIISQRIEFTDFPMSSIKLYVCDGTLMLPGEY